ncbi:MAG: hypothetical protein ACRDWA_11640 [Acidimicrobiia bacterium]
MSRRIHIVVGDREWAAYRARAQEDGLTLSEWFREAASQRLEAEQRPLLRSIDDLNRFFAECDRAEHGREPEWDQHLMVIAESRAPRKASN